MGNKVTLKRLHGHPRYRWRCSYVEGGKWRQKYFKTEKDADAWRATREAETLEHGTADTLTAEERSAVSDFRERMEAAGISIRDAITFAVECHEEMKGRGATPKEAFETGRNAFEVARMSRKISEVAEHFLDLQRGSEVSPRYVADTERKLARFTKSHGDSLMSDFSPMAAESYLATVEGKPGTRNSHHRHLKMFFNYGIRHKLAESNPFAFKLAKTGTPPARFLTPEQLQRLLDNADPEILPEFAIGAFCGIRVEEIHKLKWSDVYMDAAQPHIEISAENAKSAKRRTVPMPEALIEWLEPYRGRRGQVKCRNHVRVFNSSRLAAGFEAGISTKLRKEKRPKNLEPWPPNCLRASFASHHYAHRKNAAELAALMGHADAKLIFEVYRDAVKDPETSRKWWEEVRP